ncbi:unnamed protein product [Spirodela intermedia]|uniref:Uncharacterized protein n=2 Tax=Spirodela intermedia TaxID=51605 RepID=A0A7I8KNR0_SPIIN|nr:unnamed protein product [Spirodela intermedia]CAA6662209.1 unnamed protein product [Spirodela intermedia]CAA7398595.1 unnamed protein product [Spirodela intermedia]
MGCFPPSVWIRICMDLYLEGGWV